MPWTWTARKTRSSTPEKTRQLSVKAGVVRQDVLHAASIGLTTPMTFKNSTRSLSRALPLLIAAAAAGCSQDPASSLDEGSSVGSSSQELIGVAPPYAVRNLN